GASWSRRQRSAHANRRPSLERHMPSGNCATNGRAVSMPSPIVSCAYSQRGFRENAPLKHQRYHGALSIQRKWPRTRLVGSGEQFGKVSPRERGDGWRVDVRPFGYVYSVSGEAFTQRGDAEAVLSIIRMDLRAGKPHEDAVGRFLGPKSKPNLVVPRYQE